MNINESNVLRVVGDLYKIHPLSDDLSSSSSSSNSSNSTNSSKSKRIIRKGGVESYGTINVSNNIFQQEATRCYRVLTYKDKENKDSSKSNNKLLIDILTGKVFNSGINKITTDALVYKTKQAALGERFPPNQVGHPKCGSGIMPRVLAAFDCWGESKARIGGGYSSTFQFVKFIGIVECLDPISPHSLKHTTIPVAPHFFPKSDRTPPPRIQNNRTIRVTRSLNS